MSAECAYKCQPTLALDSDPIYIKDIAMCIVKSTIQEGQEIITTMLAVPSMSNVLASAARFWMGDSVP